MHHGPAPLDQILDTLAPHIPRLNCRLFPASFDPLEAELQIFPRSLEWLWSSCEESLRAFAPRVVMTRLPAFWQLEPPLHDVCRRLPCPILINDQNNMPLGAAAISAAAVDTIVTETADAIAFSAYLLERNVPIPKNWLIVHKAGAPWDCPSAVLDTRDVRVAQEVHAFPGCPILIQCPALAERKHRGFHLSPDYVCGDSENTLVGGESSVLPSHILQFPFSLKDEGPCSCGKTMYVKV